MKLKIASIVFTSLFTLQNVHLEPFVEESKSTGWFDSRTLEVTALVAAIVATAAISVSSSEAVISVFKFSAPVLLQCATFENILKVKSAILALWAGSELRQLITPELLEKVQWFFSQVVGLYVASHKIPIKVVPASPVTT